jgi:hypothetical protein
MRKFPYWIRRTSGLLGKATKNYHKDYPGFSGVFVFYPFRNYEKAFNLYYTQSGVHRTVNNYGVTIQFPKDVNLNDMKDMTGWMDYWMSEPRNNCFSIKLYKYSSKSFDFDIIRNRDLKWALLNSRHKFRNYRWLSQILISGRYVINDK